MKTLLILILTASLSAFTACEKEAVYIEPLALNVIPGEPVNDCGWTPCDQAIAETKQVYQALANSLCDTVWVDITCCLDGQETYALVFVAPDAAGCFPRMQAAYE